MGHSCCEEIENKARGEFYLVHYIYLLTVAQSITIIPRKNRLRIYVDGPDKYYRLRELKRALPDVVVKVFCVNAALSFLTLSCIGRTDYPPRYHQHQRQGRCAG